MIHAKYTTRADPTACIISAGTRKMPLPMMVPTTTAPACDNPRSRESSGFVLTEFIVMSEIPPCFSVPSVVQAFDFSSSKQLPAYPTANVTHVSIATHHVNATCDNRQR